MMRLIWLSELFLGAWWMVLLNGTVTVMTEGCGKDKHVIYTTKGRICCPKCEKNIPQESCEHENMECRCTKGYGCQTRSCTECTLLPVCKNGQRLNIMDGESSFYTYRCENCSSGTILDTESGLCNEQSTIISSTRGPTTKNSTFSNEHIANNAMENMWTVVCVLVFFFLLLITIVIHLLIWKMRTAKSLKMEGDLVHPHTNVPINTKEDGDTWSYQYPEEEHGDGALNNKLAAI